MVSSVIVNVDIKFGKYCFLMTIINIGIFKKIYKYLKYWEFEIYRRLSEIYFEFGFFI